MSKQLYRLPPGKVVTTDQYNELLDWVKERTNIKCGPGMEVRHMAGGMFVSLIHSPLAMSNQTAGAEPPGGGASYFFARITASSGGSTDNQWNYTFAEVHRDAVAGYEGHWYTRTGGKSGTAYNLTENMNQATGLCGNGVNATNLAADFPDFAIQPAPVDTIVVMYTVTNAASEIEYWFQYENAVDGGC